MLTFSRPRLRDKKFEDEERVGDGVSSERTDASDAGTGEDRDADVEDASGEGFVGSHQRLHPALIKGHIFIAGT